MQSEIERPIYVEICEMAGAASSGRLVKLLFSQQANTQTQRTMECGRGAKKLAGVFASIDMLARSIAGRV